MYRNYKVRTFFFVLLSLVTSVLSHAKPEAAGYTGQSRPDSIVVPGVFIHTGFENASPANWEVDSAGRIIISLIYDHERFSLNRANNHWHFKVEAPVGKEVTLILQNFDNVWNNTHASPISKRSPAIISADGKNWESRPGELLPDNRLMIKLKMTNPSLYVASVEPYRLSDLDKFLARIKKSKQVSVTPIGKTSEGRTLEIIRIGNEKAPKRIFLRARAHAFEAGGNWTVEGLVQRLLQDDSVTKLYLKNYCVYILPMANKDGVARGKTRFNSNGYDLNRKWDKPADSTVAPENYYLEKWILKMIRENKKPDLAIDLHNDAGGFLHVSRPAGDITGYLANMQKLETLLRQYTWFTEGSTKPSFRNPGSLGEGFMERFDVEAAIYELNYEWVEGLKKVPLASDWISLGSKLPEVFYNYFKKP